MLGKTLRGGAEEEGTLAAKAESVGTDSNIEKYIYSFGEGDYKAQSLTFWFSNNLYKSDIDLTLLYYSSSSYFPLSDGRVHKNDKNIKAITQLHGTEGTERTITHQKTCMFVR